MKSLSSSLDKIRARSIRSALHLGLVTSMLTTGFAGWFVSNGWAQDAKPVYTISDKAMEIHRKAYVFDGHNDLPWEIRKFSKRFDDCDISKPQPKLHTDIERLRKGNVGAVLVGIRSSRNDAQAWRIAQRWSRSNWYTPW